MIYLPETKHKTIEEITALFVKDKQLSIKMDVKVDEISSGVEGTYKPYVSDTSYDSYM